jgi:hypothetical protein
MFRMTSMVGAEPSQCSLSISHIAHPDRTLCQVLLIIGKRMRLHIVHHLQLVFDIPQKAIGLGEASQVSFRQESMPVKPLERIERIARHNSGQSPAHNYLDRLREKLDLADAADS